jgi:putative FmdB family regulatory protein
MPFYEFYCADCHTLFNFFARRVNVTARPDCPGCGRPGLQRRPSRFGISRGTRDAEAVADRGLPDLDGERLERAMAAMAGELERLDENDPRAMGQVMRQLFHAAGLKPGPGMEEAVQRMEAGEDPDRIERELGDTLEAEDPFQTGVRPDLRDLRRCWLPPRVDTGLYELP